MRQPAPAAAGLALLVVMAGVVSTLAGCGASPGPAPLPSHLTPRPTPSPSSAPTTVTVIAPLGVNFRSAPSATAPVVGVIPQAVSLPLLSASPAAGGWWKVQGATQVGWITADPQYTSTLSFQVFEGAGSVPWSVMYPEGWTFDQKSSGDVAFTGPKGATVTFETAVATSQLPPAASAGQTQSGVSSVEVYGVTVSLVRYASSNSYQASVEFQAQSALSFLVQATLPQPGGAATFSLFLNTVFFTEPATPAP
ncbi:MAG TPA: hypothetical protein VI138_02900 [Candidatus Dormibacteraeota bacterium]